MQFPGGDRDQRATGPRSVLKEIGGQPWAWLAVFIAGLVVGVTVTILFRPLILAIIVVLLAVMVYRMVRFFRRGSGSAAAGEGGPVVRGMVISGRYGEPGAGPVVQDRWQDAFDVPAAEPVERARPAATARPVDAAARPAPAARTAGAASGDDEDVPAPARASDADIDAILARIDQQIASEGKAPGPRPRRPGATGTGEILDAEVRDPSSRS